MSFCTPDSSSTFSLFSNSVILSTVALTDDRRLRDFYHIWTNSILQQVKRKVLKIADALFRISSMTDSFK
jgi:hypothetical protein